MDLTTPATFNEAAPAKRTRQLAPAFSGSELEDALATMRRTGVHVARVFDAEGNTTGALLGETRRQSADPTLISLEAARARGRTAMAGSR